MQRRENLGVGLRGWPKFKSFYPHCTAREGGTPKFCWSVFSGIADHFSNGSEQKISGRTVAQRWL
jgi:hypothetical protein